jgi:hypothetical protein
MAMSDLGRFHERGLPGSGATWTQACHDTPDRPRNAGPAWGFTFRYWPLTFRDIPGIAVCQARGRGTHAVPDRECTVTTRREVIEASIAAFADGRLSDAFVRSMARTVERDLVDWEARALRNAEPERTPESVDEESR